MKCDVHIFAVVRVKIANVKARSQTEAIRIAERKVDLYRLFDSATMAGHTVECGASETEYADELSSKLSYLVDVGGDTNYVRSKRFDENYKEIPG